MVRFLPVLVLLAAPTLGLAQQIPSSYVPAPDSAITRSATLLAGEMHTPRSIKTYLPVQENLRQVSGVQVTPYSGVPGSPAVIRIRGAANLAEVSHPLYVVDGVPQFVQALPEDFVTRFDGLESLNPLLSIPAEEIESIEVIKGAYETALYGQYGSDGVISITTRRGQGNGKLRLQYQGYGGVQTSRYRYDLLNAQEYAQLANEVADVRQQARPYTDEQVAGLGQGTDWQKEILRPAAQQSHHVSLESRSDSTQYYAAANYLNQQGIVENSYLTRYGLRVHAAHAFGKLRLEAGGSFQQLSRRFSPNSIGSALFALPVLPVRNANGEFPQQESPLSPRNPVQLTEQEYEDAHQSIGLGRVRATWQLSTGLLLDVPISLESNRQQLTAYRTAYGAQPGGQWQEKTAQFWQLAILPSLRYQHEGANHLLQVSVGGQRQQLRQRETYEHVEQVQVTGSGGTATSIQLGLQTTARYVLAGRYEARGTLRYDGSSRFSAHNRWDAQPGLQLIWHAGQEPFLPNKASLPALDVWMGWSQMRASEQAVFRYSSPLGGQINFIFEQQQQHLDAGLHLLYSGFDVTLQAYHRSTQLQSVTPGYRPLDAEVTNKGVELTASRAWQAGPVGGTTQLTGSLNQNLFKSENFEFDFLYTNSVTMANKPLSGWRGATYLGPDPATGYPRYLDEDANGYADYAYQGSGLPKQLVSISQQLTFRRFRLDAQVDGMFGYVINNLSQPSLIATDATGNASGQVRNRWTPTNPATDIPGAGYSQRPVSTFTLQSGNHWRLTSLTVHYQFWEKYTHQLSLWAGGHNLLVLSKYRGYDPNVSSNGSDARRAGFDNAAYPTARTFLLGVQATL